MNTPQIRFKGFTDVWEQRRLKDIGKATSGTSIESEFCEDGKYRIISIGSYSENSTYTDQNIRANLTDKTKPRILNRGDLTMILNDKTSSGNIIGRVLLIDNSDFYVYNQRTERIEPDSEKFDSLFLYEMLNAPKTRDKIIKQAQGNTQIYVNWSTIGELEYLIPQKDEQKKLGELFFFFDDLITLHQREYSKTVNIKKALLEKMFPKDGANKPEIRFEGFTDAWEERRLGDVGATFTGLSGKTKEDFGHGDAEFITYMNVFANPITASDGTENVEIDGSQSEVKYGDVFFTTSSETPEEVGMSSVWLENRANVYLNSFCFGWRSTVNIDSHYLAYMLRSSAVRKKFTFLAQGISRYNISKNKVMEMSVPLPCLDEQAQIGALFTHLDDLITLHRREHEKLKNIKQALLEKMFPKEDE